MIVENVNKNDHISVQFYIITVTTHNNNVNNKDEYKCHTIFCVLKETFNFYFYNFKRYF